MASHQLGFLTNVKLSLCIFLNSFLFTEQEHPSKVTKANHQDVEIPGLDPPAHPEQRLEVAASWLEELLVRPRECQPASQIVLVDQLEVEHLVKVYLLLQIVCRLDLNQWEGYRVHPQTKAWLLGVVLA